MHHGFEIMSYNCCMLPWQGALREPYHNLLFNKQKAKRKVLQANVAPIQFWQQTEMLHQNCWPKWKAQTGLTLIFRVWGGQRSWTKSGRRDSVLRQVQADQTECLTKGKILPTLHARSVTGDVFIIAMTSKMKMCLQHCCLPIQVWTCCKCDTTL